jgi:hypothetical protein
MRQSTLVGVGERRGSSSPSLTNVCHRDNFVYLGNSVAKLLAHSEKWKASKPFLRQIELDIHHGLDNRLVEWI